MNLDLKSLNNIDINNAGSWPVAGKVAVIGVLCLCTLFGGYWFDTKSQIEVLKKERGQEVALKQSFEGKQRRAVNLEPLKQQLAEMKATFGGMLRLLPSKTEIEGLLVDISQAGLASGLEFELFKPEAEVSEDFYAVQPIKIKVVGSYHEFGEFISTVANLPRIVTQHDIGINPFSKGMEKKDVLSMELVAKTYRYLEDGEVQD
ncbi:MAG: type 4a pilus biogenesis protein PilO [Gammaproteobacteria bacterium]|jgi:type IV pilus assembly protein PilO